jgi:nucleoside-diphosphate-sugar epimerase
VWAGLRSLEVRDTLGIAIELRRRIVLADSLSQPDLSGIEVIVHAAAQVPNMDRATDQEQESMHRINMQGTLTLARQAAAAGVRRFVFLSSIKVNGEITAPGRAWTEDDSPAPVDAYGRSKWQAEQGLWEISALTGLEVVIVRLPLVYGPGVKGNVAALVKWVGKGVPLPLKSVRNQRSLLALDNLASFIGLCVDRQRSAQAAGQVFLLSDGEDVSTGELLRRVAAALVIRARLWPFPVALLRLAAAVTGMRSVADRLLGSLVVDSSKARRLLGWQPVVTMDQQLRKMVDNAARV